MHPLLHPLDSISPLLMAPLTPSLHSKTRNARAVEVISALNYQHSTAQLLWRKEAAGGVPCHLGRRHHHQMGDRQPVPMGSLASVA